MALRGGPARGVDAEEDEEAGAEAEACLLFIVCLVTVCRLWMQNRPPRSILYTRMRKRTDDDEHEEEPANLHDGLCDHLHQRARGPEPLEEVEGLPPVSDVSVCIYMCVCVCMWGGGRSFIHPPREGRGGKRNIHPTQHNIPTRAHPPEHDRHDGEAVGDGLGRGEDDGVQVERAGPGVDPRPFVGGVVVLVSGRQTPQTGQKRRICRIDRTPIV